jgi:hypothetical protein
VVLIIPLLLCLAACMPLLGGGEGSVTITLPGGDGRATVDPSTLSFSGPGEGLTRTTGPGEGRIWVSLSPGDWAVRAEARLDNALFGTGGAAFTVAAGQNASVTIAMRFSACAITAFRFDSLSPPATGTINMAARTVAVAVPYGTALNGLAPAITVSEGANINPASGAAQNFSGPVTYIVTAADGSAETWTVTVTVAPSFDTWDGISVAGAFDGGTGAAADPYRVRTGAQLAYLRQQVNAGTAYVNTYFTLTGYLDLNNEEWTAIGTVTDPFKGIFDGAGHIIYNLYINKSGNGYQGLFGYLNGATIQNLGLENINVTGWDDVGGVAGYVSFSSSIEYCYSTGNVTGTGNYTGGVAGNVGNSSSIEHCYSTGNISGTQYVGGIAGYASYTASIEYCYSTGNITGTAGHVGGIAGQVYNNIRIENSYSTGNVSGAGSDVGGVAGRVETNSSIENSYSTGNVSGGHSTGGIAGEVYNSGSIKKCYSTGDVSGGTGNGVGGVAGQVYDGVVTDCAALNPSVTAGSDAGRIVGYINGTNTITGNVARSGMTVTRYCKCPGSAPLCPSSPLSMGSLPGV